MANSEERGRQASVDGFAHEHIVVGILMKASRIRDSCLYFQPFQELICCAFINLIARQKLYTPELGCVKFLA